MKETEILTQEIRINPDYSHLGFSEYEEKDPATKKSKPIINTKSVLTNDFTNRLSKTLNDELVIYPPNCRYLERTDRGTIVLIEEPPAIRTVRVSIKMESLLSKLRTTGKLEEYGYDKFKYGASPHRFTLAFPYVIFLLFFNDYHEFYRGQVYLRSSQMTGFSDNLLRIPMLNVTSGGDVCFGDKVYGKHQSLNAVVMNTINVFWGASFNFDYRDNLEAYRNTPIINNYLEWQYFTQVDPMFIYSVDWIPTTRNIYQTINKMKEKTTAHTRNYINYRDMVRIFTKPIETGKTKKPTPRSRKTHKLYYDICSSVYLTRDITLNIGDPILMKNGETAFVYSFIGFATGGDVKHVQFEKNGKLFQMEYTESFKRFMIKQIKKYRYAQEVTLENGEVLKPGSIIVVEVGKKKIYKKIEYMRKARNMDDQEVFEIKCGPNFYRSNTIKATVFNVDEPTISGEKIKKDKVYLYVKETDSVSPLVSSSKVKYLNLDVSSQGTIVTKFQNVSEGLTSDRYNVRLDYDRKIPSILPMDNMRPINGIFRIGRKYYISKRNNKPANDAVWAYNGTIFYENLYSLVHPNSSETKDLIKDDTFFIQGSDFDTTFTIGDKVIVANWTKPIEVLSVKTIQGFKHDADYGSVSFILSSKDGKLTEEPYLNGKEGTIKTGYIRRVTNSFEKLSTGTKIIAKNSGISNFPKKDVNIVVAIIIDGPHEPLVLCSNGCTLWYSTIMSKFQKVGIKAKRWAKLTHAPLDLSKIKFQAGDIINGRRDYFRESGYIIFDPSTTRYLKVLPLAYYPGYPDHQIFDKYFYADAIFECIPNPRLTVAQQTKLGTMTGFIDLHGGIIPDPYNRSLLTFTNERGGIDV